MGTTYYLLLWPLKKQELYSTDHKLNGGMNAFIIIFLKVLNLLSYVNVENCHISKLHLRPDFFLSNLPCFDLDVFWNFYLK
jgi:hypothetical protein